MKFDYFLKYHPTRQDGGDVMTSHNWKALTPIWTGDADRKSDRLIPTGLMGSLRWWFEVLVRGLGGKACDPTSPARCPHPDVKEPTKPGHHCVVCELFGCTGWARKFRMMVLDEHYNVIQNQINADQIFILRFIPLRPIYPEEWCLLDCTLRIIAEYGAIGGRTVLKPSDELNRQNALHHKDYGLIQYISGPENWHCEKTREDLKNYVGRQRWRNDQNREHDFSWTSFQNFWCVKGRYLARKNADESTFNQVVGRAPSKRCKDCNQVHSPRQKCPKTERHPRRYSDDNPTDPISAWLAGRQQESKKVFSFKHPQEGGRTFGFIKPDIMGFEEIKRRLQQAWPDLKDSEFLTGEEILQRLWGGTRP
ncbi:hypothetical protein HRbin30_03143 [bacterium HR30]|nr:hypothetical protein HRbin30_03143 [bacterium HR30]